MKLCATVAVIFCIAAVPIRGQESPLPDLFSDVIDVRVVNVEVVVTDRKGNRISGLQPDDFELLVDRQPVPIDYFTEIRDGQALASSDDSIGAVPALTADEPVATSYLVFVDDLFAIQRNRDRVLKRLEEDLVRLGPADRVAVVAYDGRGLTLLTDWTGSPDRIEDALRQSREREARGLLYAYGMGAGRAEKTRRSVMAAAGAVRSFANAPGRKVMLLLIEGWASPYSSWNARSAFTAATAGATLDRLYGPLVDAANLVGYSLYPIDLPGFTGPNHGSFAPVFEDWFAGYSPDAAALKDAGIFHRYTASEWTAPVGITDVPDRPRSALFSPGALWRRRPEHAFHDLLRFLAEETGGLPMINSFSKKALAETVEDTRSYYWLGFKPPRSEDDAVHEIRVRLPGHRHLRVRTRENYADMSKTQEVSMLVEGTLLLGGAPGTESLDVSFGTPRKAGFRRIMVPMMVTIPLEDVELLPMNGLWMNELEFRLRLMDEFGDSASAPVAKIPVAMPNEPAPGDHFIYETELLMRKREHSYVVAVYDPLTGDLLSASGDVGPQ